MLVSYRRHAYLRFFLRFTSTKCKFYKLCVANERFVLAKRIFAIKMCVSPRREASERLPGKPRETPEGLGRAIEAISSHHLGPSWGVDAVRNRQVTKSCKKKQLFLMVLGVSWWSDTDRPEKVRRKGKHLSLARPPRSASRARLLLHNNNTHTPTYIGSNTPWAEGPANLFYKYN